MWMADRLGRRRDEGLAALVLDRARRLAWRWAEHLAGPLGVGRQEEAIVRLDRIVADLGGRILAPGLQRGSLFSLVRLREGSDVREGIRALAGRSAR
jgi:hypothetical protein